jgi:hypothetical protein
MIIRGVLVERADRVICITTTRGPAVSVIDVFSQLLLLVVHDKQRDV